MKFLKKAAAVLLAAIVLAMTLAGCAKRNVNTVALFGNEEIRSDEAALYVYVSQLEIESSNEFLIKYYYGGYDKFWDQYWESNLVQAMQQLYQTRLLAKAAKDSGMTLSDSEKAELEEQIEHFKLHFGKSLTVAGATDELLRRFVEDNAYATKFHLEMLKDVDTNFDADAMRRKKITGVSISAKATYKPGSIKDVEESGAADEPAESGEVVESEPAEGEPEGEPVESEPVETEKETEKETESTAEETKAYTDAEKEANIQKALDAILADMNAGKTVAEIVEAYKNDITVTVSSIGNGSAAPTDAKAEDADTYAKYQTVGWEMKTGENRGEIILTTSATKVGYVLHCDNDDDPDLRKSAEETELANRKTALFAEKIQKLQANGPKFHVYTDKLTAIKYKGALLVEETPASTEAESKTETESETEHNHDHE